MSTRAVPFHCPYCGDENLWPFEARRLAPQEPPHDPPAGSAHGAWECRSCLRAFTVSMIGQLARPPVAGGDTADVSGSRGTSA